MASDQRGEIVNVTDIQLKNAIADHEKRCHKPTASDRRESTDGPLDGNKNVDAALDLVLMASGSALKNCTLPENLNRMREAMRQVMSQSYIAGSNAAYKSLTGVR